MGDVILFTGGARSGKSLMAEQLIKKVGGDHVLYIATAAICDEEMEDRVKKHREQRPASWTTLEQFWNFDSLGVNPDFVEAEAILLDCLGFMLNNIMFTLISDWENLSMEEMERVEGRMLSEIDALLSAVKSTGKILVVVTNEVGMGLIPADRSSRFYRDILGRANRKIAEASDGVCFMVSGIPMWVKGEAL